MSRVFSEELVSSVAKEMKVADLQNATIGDVLLVASRLEELTGIPFIRMDQGSPGLPANRVGIEAEKAALDKGLGAQYPAAAGVPELKEAASRFVKAFIDIDISPRACLPTTGSVAASFRLIHCLYTAYSRQRQGALYRSGLSYPKVTAAYFRHWLGVVRYP